MRGHFPMAGFVVCIVGLAGACPSEVTVAPPSSPGSLEQVAVADAQLLLQVALPPLIGRVATAEERARLEAEGVSALLPVLERALSEPAFAESARTLIERKLSVSGSRDGVDFDLPGNLAAHTAGHALPWSTILTSETCYDATDQAIGCDTGAPYAAGVIATRGYLVSRAGRFNLTRASTLLRAFACEGYPQSEELEPPLPKDKLIPLFRAETAAEIDDPRAAGGFGNGDGCYACHGQFGAHAQLFVRFDEAGRYRTDATGEQAEPGELGRSFDGLMTSHFADPLERGLERSQMFGEPVENLAEAMRVFTRHPAFASCTARNVLEHALLVDPSIRVDPRLLERIAQEAKARAADPSLQDYVIAALTDPLVITSVATSLRGSP